MTGPKRIGIAIVENGGRFLVGIRGPDVPLPGYAEFPGGKCLPDETALDCAVRECQEETGLAVSPQKLLDQIEFEYPHGKVDLHFVLCHPVRLAVVREQHEGFHWASLEQLKTMKFPEANAGVIELLENLILA